MATTPDDLVAMLHFVRVVEAGSFTGAATKLGVSKSVVSERIAALEARLGVRLLHRTTRRLSLTSEGLALYERSARFVVAADEASLVLAGASKSPRGLLSISAPIVFAQDHLVPPIAAFLARYPDVRVEVSLADRVVDLTDERVDVAIRITSRLSGAGLVARKLARDRTVLCASPAYLARRGTPTRPEELLGHECLVYSLLEVADEWRFRSPGQRAVVSLPVEGRLRVASGSVLRTAALEGMGLAVLPTFMITRELAEGRLVRVLESSFVGVELGIHAVYAEAKPVPSKIRAFVDLLAAHFRTPHHRAAR